MDLRPWLVMFLFTTSMFAGCFGEQEIITDEAEPLYDVYPDPEQRTGIDYDDTDIYARVTENGSYAIDAVRSVYVEVPTITAADGGSGVTGETHYVDCGFNKVGVPKEI